MVPKMLDTALRNSQFMLGLINDYLSLEKLSSGALPLNTISVDLNALAASAVEACRALGAKTGVTLELVETLSDAKVRADPDRLRQILNNLLSNAVKFSPDRGVVTVSVRREGAGVRVSVADKGPGIPENFRDKIFGRFAQAEGHKKGGSGLGLAISKAIVERHGGRIGFETGAKGTAFYFELPEVSA
jgi:signal transduction histidine kinase